MEVLGDRLAEPTENFYLEAFDPVNASFGPGVVTLVASRTIVDNDGVLFG